MKLELKENQGVPSSLLWTLAIISGVTVANIYYNQPLLNRISRDLNISEFTANLIAMCSQIGYAIGLLFIIPLGDLYRRRNIILVNISILVVSLLTIALAPNIHLILFASLLTGACSVIPQIFMPLAAQYSTPETKGKNVGIILSGLLTGILASRVVSGIVGEYMGWRFIYFIAAGLMVVCLLIIIRILPDLPSNYQGSYAGLMKSLFSIVKKYPPTPHSFVACRFLVRIVPCHVELSGFQDGAGAFLCGKQYHRNVGSLRHNRGTDRFFHRKIHQYGRGETTYLYRMFADNQCMDSALCGTI